MLTRVWTYAPTLPCTASSLPMQASVMWSMACDIVAPGLASTDRKVALTLNVFCYRNKVGMS